ncbi:hypothetical protein PNOK_0775700 [Pyrrhoderma noxium]|uniref:Uncharacterized protein n=1 Tax=Pyrrhoderma noxium TaxID=2282107 RepID=A0A286U980_9AGAM|nr:hypothetical protein PNOK_0775700 [Pyrrhoderma noxium]
MPLVRQPKKSKPKSSRSRCDERIAGPKPLRTNSFFIFRSESALSSWAGQIWRTMSIEEKGRYARIAEVKRATHRKLESQGTYKMSGVNQDVLLSIESPNGTLITGSSPNLSPSSSRASDVSPLTSNIHTFDISCGAFDKVLLATPTPQLRLLLNSKRSSHSFARNIL